MAPIRALIAFAMASALASVDAHAQTVTSPAPDSVGVTIYRDPDRAASQRPNLGWLQGYALVTEQRTITIPAGRAVVRFEGVAGGILPESAIVTGLPDGVREKNLDADLLSPRSLYARSIGRPVTIRRTRGGKATEERAIIRSGPDGAAVLETSEGVIAVDCTGSEALVYDGVPAGLSAKPTLSVETESTAARQVTVTLSYLAWGFDWQANYVATMRPDGKTADLFAWVTLASSDVTSFTDAETMVVAGEVNREDDSGGADRVFDGGDTFQFQCLSQPPPPPPPPPAPPPPPMMAAPEMIVVTGMRASLQDAAVPVTVVREALGDLQAYRVPHRTTVASQSQKQVALLVRESVPVDVIYKSGLYGGDASRISITLRAQNREARGLGVPLPAGNVAVFEPLGASRALIGEAAIEDKAVGEEVEIEIAQATQVQVRVESSGMGKGWIDYVATVTNANPFPVRFEAVIHPQRIYGRRQPDTRLVRVSSRLGRKNGSDLWSVEVPANGSSVLRYRAQERRGAAR